MMAAVSAPKVTSGHRARVGALALGVDQDGEEVARYHQCAHREQDHAQVEGRLGAQRHVGGEEHVRLAREHLPLDHERPHHHQREGDPAHLGCWHAAVQQYGGGEVEHRHLEEDDEEDQHVHAVHREDPVEPHHVEQVHGLPAGEQHQDGGHPSDQERDGCRHGVGLDQGVGGPVDPKSGGRTCACVGAHCAPPSSEAA